MSQNLLETLKNSPWNDSLVKEAKDLGLIKNNTLTEAGLLELLDQKLVMPEITEVDCKKYWDDQPWLKLRNPSVHASHVLIAIMDSTPLNHLQEKAEDVFSMMSRKINLEPHNTQKILKETAKEFSNCPSAERGGDLGHISPDDLAPEMVNAFFGDSSIGLRSEVLKSRHGFHLVFIHERLNEGSVSFEESKEKIKAILAENSYEEALRSYLTTLSR